MFFAQNEITEGDGFFISYLPHSSSSISFFSGDDCASETALAQRDGTGRGKYYILNGDFREQYKALIPQGWDACYAFYLSQKAEHRSSWSEDKSEVTA